MNRFWIFPLVLGVVGALFLPLCFVEGVWPLVGVTSMWQHNQAVKDYLSAWPLVWHYHVGAGIVAGIVAGLLNFRRVQSNTTRFIGNLRWCLLWALLLTEFNVALIHLFGYFHPSNMFARILWREDVLTIGWFLALLFNFSAVTWATIRTISTDDVLWPRVLLRKLKRSTQLSG